MTWIIKKVEAKPVATVKEALRAKGVDIGKVYKAGK